MQDPPIQYCKNVSILYPSILFILSFDYYNINTEISFNNGEIFLETSSSSENEYSSE